VKGRDRPRAATLPDKKFFHFPLSTELRSVGDAQYQEAKVMKKLTKPMQPEQVVFDELAELCVSPGYVHAIAYLCYRDNLMKA
jgi:hypothetical protein